MDNIKYMFTPEKGKIYDFFAVLSMSTKYKNLQDSFKDLNLEVNPSVAASFFKISNNIPKNNIGINLFCSVENEKGSFIFSLLSEQIIKYDSIDEILTEFRQIPHDKLFIKLLGFYDFKNNFSEHFYKMVLESKELLAEYIDSLDVSSTLKWNINRFITSPEIILSNVYEVFDIVKETLDYEYKLNETFLQDYYNTIINEYKKSPQEFLRDKVKSYNRMLSENFFQLVQFCIVMFSPFDIQFLNNREQLNIYLGHGYEKSIELSEEAQVDPTTLFKAFTDEIRIKIIILLKEREMYVGQVARATGVPHSSLSHHIDVLERARVIERVYQGKKIMLKLRRNAILAAMDVLEIYAE